jgi:hypothetical protein
VSSSRQTGRRDDTPGKRPIGIKGRGLARTARSNRPAGGLSALRGAAFHVTLSGVGWFAAAALLFTVFMYGLAEAISIRLFSRSAVS